MDVEKLQQPTQAKKPKKQVFGRVLDVCSVVEPARPVWLSSNGQLVCKTGQSGSQTGQAGFD